jgi:hypothetical protein
MLISCSKVKIPGFLCPVFSIAGCMKLVRHVKRCVSIGDLLFWGLTGFSRTRSIRTLQKLVVGVRFDGEFVVFGR